MAVVAVLVAMRRGVVLGVIAGVVYGAAAVAMTVSPGGLQAWSRRHPFLDGDYLGPLVFLARDTDTAADVGLLVAGGGGVAMGLVQGGKRRRYNATRGR